MVVSNIEIASPDGLLVVRVEGGGKPSYQHVYRAASGVYWDSVTGAFQFNMKNDKRYGHWFSYICKVLKDELDVQLCLDASTTWTNVPDDIRNEIQLAGD